MKKIARIIALFISLVVLLACSSPAQQQLQQPEQQKRAERMTVVSSARPAAVLPAFTTFTWNEEYNQVLSALNNKKESAVKTYIRHELITYLSSKGYQYQPDPAQADVVFGFLFALEDDLADNTIQRRFGLVPGLRKTAVTDPRYAKGTFLLSVLDNELKKVYWRSALQGFVDLEKDQQAGNSERMQHILGIMMGGFPKAGR